MPEFLQLEDWGSIHNICIEIGRYSYGNGLFIGLYEANENNELEPYADLTVNLPGFGTDKNCAFVDTNNLPESERLISDYGLGKRTERVARSGFCLYSEYEFDPAALEKYCLNPEALKEPVLSHMERNDAR